MDITEKITTLADAYASLGLNKDEETPFANPKNSRQEAANAVMDAMVLTEALNDGWIPDYDNNEPKYEIWWFMRSKAAGGPGFSCYGYSFGASDSFVGARLVFRDWRVGKYAATQFPEVYEPFMTFKKFTGVSKE